MTIDEAKIFIQNAMEQSRNVLAELMLIMPKVFAVKRKSLGEYYSNLENCKKEIQACEVAVKALEEVQQYRAIGTAEELQAMKEHGGFTGVELAQIETGLKKLQEYEAIGTPEECRVAVEKQHADKPLYQGYVYVCPSCNSRVTIGSKFIRPGAKFCEDCGQKLDWSD